LRLSLPSGAADSPFFPFTAPLPFSFFFQMGRGQVPLPFSTEVKFLPSPRKGPFPLFSLFRDSFPPFFVHLRRVDFSFFFCGDNTYPFFLLGEPVSSRSRLGWYPLFFFFFVGCLSTVHDFFFFFFSPVSTAPPPPLPSAEVLAIGVKRARGFRSR